MATAFEHDGKRTLGTARRIFWAAALAGVLLALFHSYGCGRHHGMWGWHGRGGHGAVLTEEEARKKLDRAADRILTKAEATPAQKAAVSPILDDLAKDWAAFRKERNEIADDFAQAVSADRIDPERAGKIRKRAEELASKAVGKAIDASFRLAGILGPEQRGKIVGEWREKR
jgi:Spy/CpxP family protein refolding chaperone